MVCEAIQLHTNSSSSRGPHDEPGSVRQIQYHTVTILSLVIVIAASGSFLGTRRITTSANATGAAHLRSTRFRALRGTLALDGHRAGDVATSRRLADAIDRAEGGIERHEIRREYFRLSRAVGTA